MPPRLRYLSASRLSAKLDVFSSSRAALSTTTRVLAGPLSSSSSATNDLLSSTDHPRHSPVKLPFSPGRSPPRRGVSGERNAPGNDSANSRMQNLVEHASARNGAAAAAVSSNTIEELRNLKLAGDLTKQIHRRWKAGDVYAPHDLSAVEMQKFKRRGRPESDAFDVLDLNPLEEYKNFSIMSEYMTPLGRILGSAETGLRGVNQRRIAKAIRRSIGLGLMPSVYRHPEILRKSDARMRMNMNKARP